MKFLFACICLMLVSSKGEGATKAEWHQAYLEMIEKTVREPTRENIMALADEIASNDKYYHTMDEEGFRLNEKARNTLCQIPGHAQYFIDEIEKERSKITPGGYRGALDRQREWLISGTLAHLPSPETILVLGKLLSDERDAPFPKVPDQDWTDLPANCFLAVDVIGRIGLRAAPTTKLYLYQDRSVLDANRAWWEEIKSGNKTFSFKGQKVEYRFKPDGTWDATALANPPDDAPKPKPPPALESPVQPTPPPSSTPLWPWLGGGVLAVLAALAYFLKSRKPSGKPPTSTS